MLEEILETAPGPFAEDYRLLWHGARQLKVAPLQKYFGGKGMRGKEAFKMQTSSEVLETFGPVDFISPSNETFVAGNYRWKEM